MTATFKWRSFFILLGAKHSDFFHYLDAIAKRIKNMGAVIAIQWRLLVIIHLVTRFSNTRHKPSQVICQQGRVRFFEWMKIRFYSQVQTYASLFEPCSTAPGQFGRFGNFNKSQNTCVKGARNIFRLGRNG